MSETETRATNHQEADSQSSGHTEGRRDVISVIVSYLPASEPFRHEYTGDSTVGTVRADAMTFFGVRDHKDRDKHEFFLEFEGRRLTNLAEQLQQLLGPHRRVAHFNLIEQVTQGAE